MNFLNRKCERKGRRERRGVCDDEEPLRCPFGQHLPLQGRLCGLLSPLQGGMSAQVTGGYPTAQPLRVSKADPAPLTGEALRFIVPPARGNVSAGDRGVLRRHFNDIGICGASESPALIEFSKNVPFSTISLDIPHTILIIRLPDRFGGKPCWTAGNFFERTGEDKWQKNSFVSRTSQ